MCNRTRLAVCLILWLSGNAIAESRRPQADRSSAGPREIAKIHPALTAAVQASEGPVKAWVFFNDKGVQSPAELDAAINTLHKTYDDRATRRRALRGRKGASLFDSRDLPVDNSYLEELRATGARIHITSRWLNAASAWVDRSQLQSIAELPFVRALQLVARGRRIHRALDITGHDAPTLNDRTAFGGAVDYGLAAEQLTQINLIALHGAGATAEGVIIGMLDTGFRRDHVAFNHAEKPLNVIAEFDFLDGDANTDIEPQDPSAQHVHGTLILGTLASYAPGDLVGAAFDAGYILCKTEDTTAEYQAEEDNYVAGLEFIEANGGDVVNSSLGYIEWYTQDDLDGRTAVTTIAVNIATANGVHCCTSAGNNGNDSDPTTSSLLAPADALQVLSCGAVDSTGAISPFSSDGPTADGRVKPEFMARGVSTWTIAAGNTTQYNSATGTSISSPLIASAVACLVQLHPEWSVDQMRQVLINSADDFVANGTHDPLFVRGYGVINAHAAGLDCNLNGLLDECDIDCGAAAGPCDVPGCGASTDCNSDGIPDDCESDCNLNGTADGCDLTACLLGDAACQDCDRNGRPDSCDDPFPQQGRIALDEVDYTCASTAVIEVNDCGMDNDAEVAESIEVVVSSDSEAGGETVVLTETGPATAKFEGTVELNTVDAVGVLAVDHGDMIIASYVDADDGLGGIDVVVSAESSVDCNPPAVSDEQGLATGPFDANITFDTDEPASATVRYGVACNALNQQVSSAQALTSFSLALSGLSDTTTYSFAIDVADALGNAASFDNDGSCYTFETPPIPNYFTEHFEDNDNDLDLRSILFVPDGSDDVYAPCTFDILDLPSDPAGGTALNFDNVDFVEVPLPEGIELTLYGKTYSTFYVGGYGYVTFEAGDDEFFDTLPHHFDLPRIAALFELLEPELGVVSWKQFFDRVTVTWEDVPSFFQEDTTNTFQIEMYFDGRIRLNYLDIDDDDGLVGLSDGTGVVPGFAETDMTALGGCGPMPPAATDHAVMTDNDVTVAIDLPAVDDGLPDPPGSLSSVISSLPAIGTLSDPGGGAITNVPYTLADNGGTVDYIPQPGFGGLDTFQFHVDDGGMPPDGGASNTATVTVTVGLPEVAFGFYMDSDPVWATEGQWTYGQPTGGGSHDGDPVSGWTGANVYGYNLRGDYTDNMLPAHLRTAALDLSQFIQTELHFERWLGVEFSTFDKASVAVSQNGIDWVTLWNNEGTTISDTSWVPQSFDISAVADGQSTVFLRWTIGPTDDTVTYPGWNIDDVEIWGVATSSVPCFAFSECADVDGNGIRDDNCVWWACNSGACKGTDIVFGDMGGQFGGCPVDGTADGNDRFHALNCFSNSAPDGAGPYVCEAAPPAAFNVDAGGPFGDCNPDGVCDGNDAFAALNAFDGTTNCSCPLDGAPMPQFELEPVVVGTATIRLETTTTRHVVPGSVIEVEVHLDSHVDDLRGFQLHLDASGGKRGDLELVDIHVDERDDRVLGEGHVWQATNRRSGQMVVGMDTDGVPVEPGYLATFTYRVSRGSTGTFSINVLADDSDPTHRTFLFPTAPGERIELDRTRPLSMTIGPSSDPDRAHTEPRDLE